MLPSVWSVVYYSSTSFPGSFFFPRPGARVRERNGRKEERVWSQMMSKCVKNEKNWHRRPPFWKCQAINSLCPPFVECILSQRAVDGFFFLKIARRNISKIASVSKESRSSDEEEILIGKDIWQINCLTFKITPVCQDKALQPSRQCWQNLVERLPCTALVGMHGHVTSCNRGTFSK